MFDQNARNNECRINPLEVPEPTECSWQGAATSYYIRSSVLGGETIAETGSSGQKMVSYVRVGSSILAHLRTNGMWQQGGWVTSEAAYYENTDPSGTGFRVTPRLMPANWWDYSDQRKAEFDSGNSNVGLETNYQPVYEPGPSENLPLESESPLYVDGQKASVTIDGVSVSWLVARQMAEAGGLQIALYDGTDRYFTDVHATTGGLSWISRVTARTTSNFNPRTEQYEISYSTDTSGISWGLGQDRPLRNLTSTETTKLRGIVSELLSREKCANFVHAMLAKANDYLEALGRTTYDGRLATHSLLEIFDAAEKQGIGFNPGGTYSTVQGFFGNLKKPPKVLLSPRFYPSDDPTDPRFKAAPYAVGLGKKMLFDPNDGGLTVIHELFHFMFHDLTLGNALARSVGDTQSFKNLWELKGLTQKEIEKEVGDASTYWNARLREACEIPVPSGPARRRR